MPQMAPMNWLFLYLFFCLIFLIFNFFNYYMFLPKNMKFNKNIFKKMIFSWKW